MGLLRCPEPFLLGLLECEYLAYLSLSLCVRARTDPVANKASNGSGYAGRKMSIFFIHL